MSGQCGNQCPGKNVRCELNDDHSHDEKNSLHAWGVNNNTDNRGRHYMRTPMIVWNGMGDVMSYNDPTILGDGAKGVATEDDDDDEETPSCDHTSPEDVSGETWSCEFPQGHDGLHGWSNSGWIRDVWDDRGYGFGENFGATKTNPTSSTTDDVTGAVEDKVVSLGQRIASLKKGSS